MFARKYASSHVTSQGLYVFLIESCLCPTHAHHFTDQDLQLQWLFDLRRPDSGSVVSSSVDGWRIEKHNVPG